MYIATWDVCISANGTAAPYGSGPAKKGVWPSHRPAARGLTTKIHVIVDALGNSVAMSLTPRQAFGQAEPLLDQVEPEALLADKAPTPMP